jgi:hypothetical protein
MEQLPVDYTSKVDRRYCQFGLQPLKLLHSGQFNV